MSTLKPSTASPHTVAFRLATKDGLVTKREARERFAPYESALKTDPSYKAMVLKLLSNEARLPSDGKIKLTSGARTVLQQMIANTQQEVAITEKDYGKTIIVKQGTDVRITLGSNPTTGYQWSVLSADNSIGLPTGKYVPGTPATTGGGGMQEFVWSTSDHVPVGKHTITLGYARPWDPSAVANSFVVTLDVEK
ncbi:MAG: protease inhibitor I42 family protein [Deltaproteobacteria bacterium]|nr:protease inhibitor I42 family protein [Deltaproteobacteria bacterium]